MGAIPAAITSGATYDAASTLITDKPQGVIAAVRNFSNNPNAGTLIDALAVPVGDALVGYSGTNIEKPTYVPPMPPINPEDEEEQLSFDSIQL